MHAQEKDMLFSACRQLWPNIKRLMITKLVYMRGLFGSQSLRPFWPARTGSCGRASADHMKMLVCM